VRLQLVKVCEAAGAMPDARDLGDAALESLQL
jgi:hypothetical protein